MSTVGMLLLIDEIIVHTTAGVPLNYPALFSDVIVSIGPFNLRGDLMFVFALDGKAELPAAAPPTTPAAPAPEQR